jgi:hypothetical protein
MGVKESKICKKSYQRKSYRKTDFFSFISGCKCFPPLTFLSELFCNFFNGFELSIEYFVIPIPNFAKKFFLLLLALLLTLKPKRKTYFINVSRIQFYIYLRYERLHFAKKVKNRSPKCTVFELDLSAACLSLCMVFFYIPASLS